MKKYAITTPDKLKELCIDNDWLKEATFNQFKKIFEANEVCCAVETMTILIWLCSPGADITYIKESLTQARKEYETSGGNNDDWSIRRHDVRR